MKERKRDMQQRQSVKGEGTASVLSPLFPLFFPREFLQRVLTGRTGWKEEEAKRRGTRQRKTKVSVIDV